MSFTEESACSQFSNVLIYAAAGIPAERMFLLKFESCSLSVHSVQVINTLFFPLQNRVSVSVLPIRRRPYTKMSCPPFSVYFCSSHDLIKCFLCIFFSHFSATSFITGTSAAAQSSCSSSVRGSHFESRCSRSVRLPLQLRNGSWCCFLTIVIQNFR